MDDPVLIDGDQVISRQELFDRIAARRQELDLAPRSIVVLSGDNSLEWVSTYLALLDAGHVPLLAGDHAEHLAAAWAASTVHADRAGCDVSTRLAVQREVHPDLALLLSTSGSTGSPKLVRISRRNLLTNAGAIVDYLGLERDRSGDHLAAAPLLLRPVRAALPPARRRQRGPHRCIRGGPLLRRRPSRSRRDEPGRCPPHLRDARACRSRPRPRAVAAVADAGRRPNGARRRHPLDRSGGDLGCPLLRDVRTDRGHCPDGLPPARRRRCDVRQPSAGPSRVANSAWNPWTGSPTMSASWSTAGRT